jgi:hypothetical protein
MEALGINHAQMPKTVRDLRHRNWREWKDPSPYDYLLSLLARITSESLTALGVARELRRDKMLGPDSVQPLGSVLFRIIEMERDIRDRCRGLLPPAISRGQAAYEADLAISPRYLNGSLRPSWTALPDDVRWSWETGRSAAEIAREC